MTSKKFIATEEEQQLANQILVMTNCHTTGALSAEAAIDIFKKSGLSFPILRDIWTIADKNGSGNLSEDELTVAIRLMGWVQMGEALDNSLLAKSGGPLPTLEGITDVVRKPSTLSHTPQFPPVNPDDVRHYKHIFIHAGPVNGILDGEKVMDSFMTSNLSYEYLSKIRNLIDPTERGALDFRQFSLGMYLIQSLQSCLISSVPASIPPELFNQFPDLQPGDLEHSPHLTRSHHSTPSMRASSSRPHLSPHISDSSASLSKVESPDNRHERPHRSPHMTDSIASLPKHENRHTYERPHLASHDPWTILPHEKLESDKHFAELDVEKKGYVDGEPVGRFFLSYGLPPEDLALIWSLADINKDNRLTPDAFAVALHLIRQRLAGEEIPTSLPPSLHQPSRSGVSRRRSMVPTSPTLAASVKNKSPPPPPPKRDRTSSIRIPNGVVTTASIPSTSGNSKYSTPLSPPLSPIPPRSHSRTSISTPSMSFMTIPSTKSSSVEVQSPFDDSAAASSSYPPSRHHTPPVSPQPRPPDHSNTEALEGFKKETARLSLQVESLLSQLTAQNKLRESNENLRNENESLKSQMRDMERTVSEVLSANDLNGSQEEHLQEVDRLTAELANKDLQIENLNRMLAVVTQDEQEVREALREAQQGATKAYTEIEDLKETINARNEETTELKSRLADMGKAMSEPSGPTDNRELRVLLRDVTRENDKLKGEVRDMQKSMERLLLSTKFHARLDELDRENKRLMAQVHDLELIATQQEFSPNGHPSSSRSAESITRENDQLKGQLKDGQRTFAQFRSTSETKIVELQQKIDSLAQENTRLKINSPTRQQTQEDNSVPPPAYDDSFVIPP